MRFQKYLRLVMFFFISILPLLAIASVESSLMSVQRELVGTFVPIAATLGFIFAGISYISGNPNGRAHLVLALIGAGVAFGASSIMSLIQNLIH